MKLTEEAQKNRNDFLYDYESTLEETDPEFAEIINNFIFDDVQKNITISKRTQMLVTLASLIANQSTKLYEVALEEALNVNVKPFEIKEVLYQVTAYVGLSKSYDFLDITNDLFDEKGIDVPVAGQSTTNNSNRMEKGYEIQTSYFGKEMIDQMNESAPEDQKHFNDFLSGYCFGDFYTRTGLDDSDREIITFSVLASLGGCENQLRAHTAANLTVGNTRETLIGALTSIMPFIGFPRTLNALAIINEVCN